MSSPIETDLYVPRDRIDRMQDISNQDHPLMPVRVFETGATRDKDDGKHDPEGFLSPIVIERFNQYMHKNRYQKDGTFRDADNWQKGIPLTAYMKSGWRHFLEWWGIHRARLNSPNIPLDDDRLEEALCAMIFNSMGYLYEVIKTRQEREARIPCCAPNEIK